MFNLFLPGKRPRRRRTSTADRRLRIEPCERRVLLSGDGFIALDSLLDPNDYSAVVYPQSLQTGGEANDAVIAWVFSLDGDTILTLRIAGEENSYASETAIVFSAAGFLDSDAAYGTESPLRRMLPIEPFRSPSDPPPFAATEPEAMVAMASMLREGDGEHEAIPVTRATAVAQVDSVVEELLAQGAANMRLAIAASTSTPEPSPPLPRERVDHSHLERSWAFELADDRATEAHAMPQVARPVRASSPTGASEEVPPANSLPIASPQAVGSANLPTREATEQLAGVEEPSDSRGHEPTETLRTSVVRDAAFSAWYGNARVERHAMAGAALAIFAAARLEAKLAETSSGDYRPESKPRRDSGTLRGK